MAGRILSGRIQGFIPVFDEGTGTIFREALESCRNLPAGIRLKRIDKRLYQTALKEEWSRDFCSNFETPEEYEQNGLGFVAMDGRKIVSGCSAYGISEECLRSRWRPGESISGRAWRWRAAPVHTHVSGTGNLSELGCISLQSVRTG